MSPSDHVNVIRYFLTLILVLAFVWTVEHVRARYRKLEERSRTDRGCRVVGRTVDEAAVWRCPDDGGGE